MIQFDFEVHSYFGNHIKVVIEDRQLRYREYMVDFGTKNDWVIPDIPGEDTDRFLESLESLDGCIEDFRNDSVLDGIEYTIICRTDAIRKTIHGYHEFQSTVRTVLKGLHSLDTGLKEKLDFI